MQYSDQTVNTGVRYRLIHRPHRIQQHQSILSPLLLVTIAALPLANEDEKAAASHGSGARHGAIRPQVRPGVNPMAALGLG